MTRLWLVLTLAFMGVGCRKAPEPETSPQPEALPTQLGQRAEFVDAATPSNSPLPTAGSIPATRPSAGPGSGEPSPDKPFKVVGSASDATADAGPTTPAHADLLGTRLEEDGQTLRAVVTMATTVPQSVPEGELIGLGVNLYTGADRSDSDYQLFLDGQPEGWFAYLSTPQGKVDYPGRLLIRGSEIIFEVPMSSVGGASTIAFDAFLDWSTTGLVPQAGEDHCPDSGQRNIGR